MKQCHFQQHEWTLTVITTLHEIRERQVSYITYMQNIKYNISELIYINRISDIESKLTVTQGEREWQRINWGFGISRYKPLYIKQIQKEDLLNSTGSYIQFLLREIKMVEQKDIEFSSSHKYIKKSTCGKMLTEHLLDAGRRSPRIKTARKGFPGGQW